MPRRPDSHIVADIALNRVMSTCADCGWAVEVVHKDYGDDLLVQPNYYGLQDQNRIWIQVKGTRNIGRMRGKASGYSISIPIDHAFNGHGVLICQLWSFGISNRILVFGVFPKTI